ncbi:MULTISPECIES: response regulator [Anaeromyxobacter]|uniref:response regulator n=1 Tax=Anaeromyxobacter TaxID=161492 RepID=UPI001F55C6FC|nr:MULTISPECIES: response regulator [unclassified Anaeromyxobacter]
MSRARILVVDDDEMHLVCTKELLEAEGYEVLVHVGAFGATQQVLLNAPDLVLVDVNMPALSGEGLVAVLRGREKTRGVRILLHSSNDEQALRKVAARLAIDGWVPKGDPGELRRRVADVLRSGQARPR